MWLLLCTLLVVPLLTTCGRSVEEKKKKAEMKKKKEEKPKKETEQPRAPRRKKRSTTTTTGTGVKPYTMSPLDKTQNSSLNPRPPSNYLAPVQPLPRAAPLGEEDLCRCKDYTPQVFCEQQYLFDLLNEH